VISNSPVTSTSNRLSVVPPKRGTERCDSSPRSPCAAEILTLCGPWARVLAEQKPTPQQLAGIAKDAARYFGDDPDDAGPIAKEHLYSRDANYLHRTEASGKKML
jgi:hypothetical protein